MERGDIVLLEFPFTGGAGVELRPGLVVQTDINNRRLNSVIVAMITSSVERAGIEPTQFLIDPATPAGRQSGLLHNSAVKCENLFTVAQSAVLRTIGKPSP